MRILQLFGHLDLIQLDVEVLIHRLERAADRDVVFELDRHLLIDQGLEEAMVVVV